MSRIKESQRLIIFLLLLGLLHAATLSAPGPTVASNKPPITQDCYTAAVFEYAKIEGTEDDSADEVMATTLATYEKVTAEAKKHGAEVIVFPEYGLFGFTNDTRHRIRPYLENIPSSEEHKVPCDEPHLYLNNSFLVTLSCMAKSHQIYLVANVGDMKPCTKDSDPNCPEDNAYQYNTNVAFDRDGKIVNRYHKKHLFYEYQFDEPSDFKYLYFDTEFGRFASFVCFDLLFKPAVTLVEEYQIDTVLFPTWWFNALPGLVSTEIQQGFALIHKVNLLASNIQNASIGSVGSGIYAGENGAVNMAQTTDGVSRLLISRIPSKSTLGKTCDDQKSSQIIPFPRVSNPLVEPIYNTLASNVSQYGFVKLQSPKDKITLCHNALCCHLEYELNEDNATNNDKFYFGVFNGTDSSRQHYFWCVEVCVLTAGFRPDANPSHMQHDVGVSTVFKHVEIRGQFSTKYVYPSVLRNDTFIAPKKSWNFSVKGKTASVSVLNFDEPIFAVSLFGRCYDRDPVYRQ